MVGKSGASLPPHITDIFRPFRCVGYAHLLLNFALCVLCCNQAACEAAGRLFSPPPGGEAVDEVILLSTRNVGSVCSDQAMSRRLHCEKISIGSDGRPRWVAGDWRATLSDETIERSTVVYVHGNRISRGEDRSQGLQVYRSLIGHGRPDGPIRFVIWSWPAAQVPGPVKDYKLKANRTRPTGWQLAWYLDKLPAQARISMLGYSYGARVASGAMHVLGGGSLGGLKLTSRMHPQRRSLRVAFLAAAFDADWIQPGHFHGRALSSNVERLILLTNRLDPAMRFFHLSNGRGRVHALGKEGFPQPQRLGSAGRNLKRIDFTPEVGRSHALSDYLAVSTKMRFVWRQLLGSTSQGDSSSPETDRISLLNY